MCTFFTEVNLYLQIISGKRIDCHIGCKDVSMLHTRSEYQEAITCKQWDIYARDQLWHRNTRHPNYPRTMSYVLSIGYEKHSQYVRPVQIGYISVSPFAFVLLQAHFTQTLSTMSP